MQTILKEIYDGMATDSSQLGNPEENIYWTWENNGVGEAINTVVTETGEDRFPGVLLHEPRKGVGRGKRGLSTGNKNKVTACTKLKSLVESDRMKMHSKKLVSELKNFIRKGPAFEAKPGMTDDAVDATLHCIRLLDIVKDYDPEMTARLADAIREEGEEDSPLPFIAFSGIY